MKTDFLRHRGTQLVPGAALCTQHRLLLFSGMWPLKSSACETAFPSFSGATCQMSSETVNFEAHVV